MTSKENNKIRLGDRAIHDWYRFVASFPPHLVRDLIQSWGLTREHIILDPFTGTGTTQVEAKLLGINSVGIEANPFCVFSANTKLDWRPDPSSLADWLPYIVAMARSEYRKEMQDGIRRVLGVEQQRLLIKNSIESDPLHQCLCLAEAIASYGYATDHFNLALATTAISASNLRFAPNPTASRRQKNVDVFAIFEAQVKRMIDDLRQAHDQWVDAIAYQGDARNLSEVLDPELKFDAVITSPPYPTELNYTTLVSFESGILGFWQNERQKREANEEMLRSNSRGIYYGDADDEYLNCDRVRELAERIEQEHCRRTKEKRRQGGKECGFEAKYSQIVLQYFGGMTKHLLGLQPYLKSGAGLAYVVGDQGSYFRILVETGAILGEIAEGLGYEVVSRETFRIREVPQTGIPLKEEILILRWPG